MNVLILSSHFILICLTSESMIVLIEYPCNCKDGLKLQLIVVKSTFYSSELRCADGGALVLFSTFPPNNIIKPSRNSVVVLQRKRGTMEGERCVDCGKQESSFICECSKSICGICFMSHRLACQSATRPFEDLIPLDKENAPRPNFTKVQAPTIPSRSTSAPEYTSHTSYQPLSTLVSSGQHASSPPHAPSPHPDWQGDHPWISDTPSMDLESSLGMGEDAIVRSVANPREFSISAQKRQDDFIANIRKVVDVRSQDLYDIGRDERVLIVGDGG
jgi:hypothetical protein